MLNLLVWALELSWKILIFAFVIGLFRALIKDGKGSIQELLETIGMEIKVRCFKRKEQLVEKYMQMKEEKTAKEEKEA